MSKSVQTDKRVILTDLPCFDSFAQSLLHVNNFETADNYTVVLYGSYQGRLIGSIKVRVTKIWATLHRVEPNGFDFGFEGHFWGPDYKHLLSLGLITHNPVDGWLILLEVFL